MYSWLVEFDIRSELWKSESFALLRAVRRSDGANVLIKLADDAIPEHNVGARLSAEFGLLRELNGEHAPQPIELLETTSVRWLVMADAGGESLATLLAQGTADVGFALRVATALTAAVGAVHRRALVYGSLHPRTILCEPDAGNVWLTDFRGVTRDLGYARTQTPDPCVDEWLPYRAPERTGRMNRPIDYRSDYYSLGVLLYEMLTGSKPFPSNDVLQLSHAQIARTPASPNSVNPAIPVALAQLIMKLLEKSAERRYQSGSGLRSDLQRCLDEWCAHARIAPFLLAEHDVSDRFTIAQKLYGRESALNVLRNALQSACAESPTLVVIRGQAGIGKTSLAHELQRPVAQGGGYFISGKFDQVARAQPYAALLAALRELMRRIVTLAEPELDQLRERLVARLGNACGALAEVLPEITWLIGEHPPGPRIGPTESENRFLYLLHSLFGELVSPARPLVMFLDDLQWADAATLKVLPALLANPGARGLLIVAAYRENEVAPAGPLATVLAELEANASQFRQIALAPLACDDLVHFLRDTLRGADESVKPLAELLERKTAGNPFFVIQYLRSLHQAQLIQFDEQREHWVYRLDDIGVLPFADNVVDLVSQRIGRLTPDTQRLLAIGACIGNSFDVASLAMFGSATLVELGARLEAARNAGLIDLVNSRTGNEPARAVPGGAEYSFIHDRVQQAAYAQISAEQRVEIHAAIGRRLLGVLSDDELGERIFEVVEHLNAGAAAAESPADRAARAALNLRAARRARSTAAFDAARRYFDAGSRALAEDDAWERHYALLFELRLGACETLHLCGEFAETERVFEELLREARSRLDKARAYEIRILQFESLSRYRDALNAGREILAILGIQFPGSDLKAPSALKSELTRIGAVLETRSIESLVDLPAMSNEEARTVLRLLATLHTSWYLAGQRVFTLFNTAVMVRLSLEQGNACESSYAYALYAAMILGPVQADYESAFRFGTLAQAVNERYPDTALRSKLLMTFAWAISLWRRPIAESFPITRQAFKLGNETGLFVDATYAAFNESWFALLAKRDLQTVRDDYAHNLEYMRSVHMDSFIDAQRVILQWAAALQGETQSATSLSGDGFDETLYVERYRGQSLFTMFHHVAKLALCYTMDDAKEAWHAAGAAMEVVRDFSGTIWDELTVFYRTLTVCTQYTSWTESMRRSADADLDALLSRLHVWAENAPYLFGAHHLLASAEIARVRGQGEEAATLFRDAIQHSASAECPREHALANELFAKLCLERAQTATAGLFMRAAHASYARWGAAAKCRDLERRFATLLGDRLPARPVVSLDEVAVARAARAIASEIRLPGLLRTLMQIVMEAAGARRVLLIEDRDEELALLAEATVDASQVHIDRATPIDGTAAAKSVIQYVRKTRESIVIDDAQADARFGADPYVVAHRARSLLCMPVLNHERLAGILYLENALVAGAFTPECTEVMQVLCAQAAISLENARLYEAMKSEVEQRRVAEETLRATLSELDRLKNRLQAENVYLQSEIREQHNFGEIIGVCPEFHAALRLVELVAATESTVLILGETGTGKELIARAIHSASNRADKPFIKINCATLPPGLVESELFGHERGAFSGAIQRRIGRFELASGGTIFLDEIGEVPADVQVKLLRVLQEREFERVGGSQTIRADVRVIAATNRDLEKAMRDGAFRSDLYYRLNVFPITLPPLRQRTADIPLLVRFFVQKYGPRVGRRLETVERQTMERLIAYQWPGNIRELENIIERALIVNDSNILCIDPEILPATAPEPSVQTTAEVSEEEGKSDLTSVQRAHILGTLQKANWVVEGERGAARRLGMKPATLRHRMRKLGISRPDNAPTQTAPL